MFRVVQPWGRHNGREATVISEHPTATDAFEALERIARQAQRTGARIEAIELIVVDVDGRSSAARMCTECRAPSSPKSVGE